MNSWAFMKAHGWQICVVLSEIGSYESFAKVTKSFYWVAEALSSWAEVKKFLYCLRRFSERLSFLIKNCLSWKIRGNLLKVWTERRIEKKNRKKGRETKLIKFERKLLKAYFASLKALKGVQYKSETKFLILRMLKKAK